ncbi:hypothetical protein J4234_00985 [Candidatus Woesearchaeota archaeon]|nr:hypothetical protein [Candidatus Woesearchaeota archaeon]
MQHAQYLRHTYYADFPDSERYKVDLDSGKFGNLPPDFFEKLSQKGYGFRNQLGEPYQNLDTASLLEEIKSSGAGDLPGLNIHNNSRFPIIFFLL